MKKVLFGLLVLGLTNLVVAQSSAKEFNLELPSTLNSFYVGKMMDGQSPKIVNDLQIKVVSFSPNSAKEFDHTEKDLFEVVHKASNGEIIAFYNDKGKIVSTRAKFTNVSLPMAVRKQVFQENEGWVMTGNEYRSVFANNEVLKKSYKVKLKNGSDEKTVIVDTVNING